MNAAEFARADYPDVSAGFGTSQIGLFLALLAATVAGMGGCYLVFWRPLLSALR